MTVKFLNKKLSLDKISNLILFTSLDNNVAGLENSLFKKHKKSILETLNLNKKNFKDFLTFNLSPKLRITLIRIENQNSLINNEKLGANFFDYINRNSIYQNSFVSENLEFLIKLNKNFLNEFIFGIKIKSYQFNIYKTNKNKNKNIFFINLNNTKLNFHKNYNRFNSLVEGINFTKDLVSEPGNILHPDEYVRRIKKLSSIGLKVTIFDKKKLKQIGMNALLGVGQGSARGSYLAIIEWKGSNEKKRPLAFVGKGVCL
jgi:leucyl aminopeptidase